ncbi:MAG TPA: von Willebrand factor type A domain-containing protein, partial [Thermoanaerobaculia bacterium]|nr:von Willebrand factor type A domain-containing protein [Thermoanaerobaculia bacterium]
NEGRMAAADAVAPAPAPPAAPQMAATRAAAAAPPSLMKSAMAAELDFNARDEVFGISVDRGAFSRVKNAIEKGERPAAVNVEALVNYFAGPQKTRREVSLETEASPAPVGAEERRAILRYTIDTASVAVPAGASVPPVAADAKIEVVFEPKAVASHRLIGGDGDSQKAEASLLKNTSVTALYAIELKDGLTARQKVATVRLTYRSVADGRPHTLLSTIYGRDFARPWRAASRRHRLASLGAVWGETLKGAPSAPDVARRAEELALQEPKDAKARELASLATASSRLQSSAPTGSGR